MAKKRPKKEEGKTWRWWEVSEQLPDEGRLVIGYNDTYQSFQVCQFSPRKGWSDADGDRLRGIDYWLDADINFSFTPIKKEKIKKKEKTSRFGLGY